MPKKSNSTVKKALKPNISKVSKRPKARQEEKKAFQFEFDEFIIENAPQRIKMFAKPDANIHGQKQFQIKITKDEAGKAQFDIVFIKSPEEEISNVAQGLSIPSENDIIASIMISPDENNVNFVKALSVPSQVEPIILASATSMSDVPNLPLKYNQQNPTLNFLQTQYQKQLDHKDDIGNYIHISNINRYEKIRRELIKEQSESLRCGIPDFQNFNNMATYIPGSSLEYNPKDFAESIESFETLPPRRPTANFFPLSQLKSDASNTYLVEDEEGKQYLVKPLQHQGNERSKSRDSKYVPNGEFKKIQKKSNPVVMESKSVHHVGVGEEQHSTKSTGCGSGEIFEKRDKILNIDTGTCMEPSHETLVHQSDSNETLKSVVIASFNHSNHSISKETVRTLRKVNAITDIHSEAIVNEGQKTCEIPTTEEDKRHPAPSAQDVEMSPQISDRTFPSEINFIISSACQKLPKPKQAQVREIVSEILDYFDFDLIKGLIAKKMEDEREYIIMFMNHRGKYGLKKMEYIKQILQDKDRSLSKEELVVQITAKINQINESILALLDHKVYEENTQVTLIVERQLEKSQTLILKETSAECFIAVKYCTLQSLQEQLRRENRLIRQEVELNLSKELEMTMERIKSICGKYFP